MELSKKIENQLIESIQAYPTVFTSGITALSHLLLVSGNSYAWQDGELVDKGTKEKPIISEELAKEIYLYGNQRNFEPFRNFQEGYSPISKIPTFVSKEWLDCILQFCFEVNSVDLEIYKAELKAFCLRRYGKNGYKRNYDSIFTDFIILREYTNSLAKRYFADWATIESINDPVRIAQADKVANEIIDEILTEK
jgi:hypothetical protein